MNAFQIASASVLGRDHVAPGRNNQDAIYVCHDASIDTTVAVVCDGCGSGAHSEFGAQLGSRLVACLLLSIFKSNGRCDIESVIKRLSFGVIDRLEATGASMCAGFPNVQQIMLAKNSDSWRDFVMNHMLFTVIGLVVTPTESTVFGCGDGVALLNGVNLKLESDMESNAPPYIGYSLLRFSESNQLKVYATIPTPDLQHALIGTDGLGDYKPESKPPGKNEVVGPLDKIWKDDRFFKNPDALRRHLALLNRSVETIDWKAQSVKREHGLFKDDTSLVVVRRSP